MSNKDNYKECYQGNYSIIKTIRQANNLTQEEISRQLNITLRHYQQIESYKSLPTVIIALKLCKILNVSPFQLWDIDKE